MHLSIVHEPPKRGKRASVSISTCNTIATLRKKVSQSTKIAFADLLIKVDGRVLTQDTKLIGKLHIRQKMVTVIKKMTIFIKKGSKRTRLYPVLPSDRIRSIKRRVWRRLRVPIHKQRLFDRKKLHLSRSFATIDSYKVHDRDVLTLKVVPDTLTLFVKSERKTIALKNVKKHDRISDLKRRIWRKLGIKPRAQTLYARSKMLKNSHARVSGYGLKDRDMLRLEVTYVKTNVKIRKNPKPRVSRANGARIRKKDRFRIGKVLPAVMTIYVRFPPSKRRLTLRRVKSTDSVASIKRRVWRRTRVPTWTQVLVDRRGQVLSKNGRTVGRYKVKNKDTLIIRTIQHSFTIIVQLLSGRRLVLLRVRPTDRLRSIKRRVLRKFSVNLSNRGYTLESPEGKTMSNDSRSISAYKLKDLSVIKVRKILRRVTIRVKKEGKKQGSKRSTVRNRIQIGKRAQIRKGGQKVRVETRVQIGTANVVRGSRAQGCGAKLLSKGRRVQQSSTTHGGRAQRAVDGNTNGRYASGSCTHTRKARGSWWQVDLGRVRPIRKVVIWNRQDCCASRLNNVAVELDGRRCGVITHARRKNTVRCGCKAARRVRIRTLANSYLTLCEVRVYGQ
jgi:hypothetical protein